MSLQTPPSTASVIRIAIEPVYSVLNSFSLVTSTTQLPGLNAWVVQAATTLPPAFLHTNRLLFEGLRDALLFELFGLYFPAYLQQLREQDPVEVRNRVLDGLRQRFVRRVSSAETVQAPERERLLTDVQAYLTCVEYAQVDMPFDAVLQAEVHALLHDASALHALLVAHLETAWAMFAMEWKRVQASLSWQVAMFTRSLDEEAQLDEAFYTLTGRKLPPDIAARVTDMREIVLVPTWHNGRHLTVWEDGTSAMIFFSEPPNYDAALLHATSVGRPELRARLAALSDETRLRILELLAQQDEMPAQDIIAALALSQSSVSRHLKQLVSLGYLYERRGGEGANKTYRLSSFYIDRTARALEQLVAGEETRPEAVQAHPHQLELRRFLDRNGKLTLWPPAKQRDKLLILTYLVGFFEPGRIYHEREVNELLLLHSLVKDEAALRRALCEYRFMDRTRDGSQYWLLGSEVAEERA